MIMLHIWNGLGPLILRKIGNIREYVKKKNTKQIACCRLLLSPLFLSVNELLKRFLKTLYLHSTNVLDLFF
jgi:hypothetical protein